MVKFIKSMGVTLNYRRDIDGLRALAVLAVVAFHSGLSFFSGGYVGVDIFFVISGYLITSLVVKEVSDRTFSFANFYSRRVVRLAPALIITLFFVMVWGFVFYHSQAFDRLGKEIFYSSFGVVNILFAQGIDYFAKNEAYQPLIHLWSLGVEEQFYLLWPLMVLVAYKIHIKAIFFIGSLFFITSLWLSIEAVEDSVTKGYFLLHYRAFELLVGALLAMVLLDSRSSLRRNSVNSIMSGLGMGLIVCSVVFLDTASNFPGLNALIPCVGAALIIAFPSEGFLTKMLSSRAVVFIGLISYPLYLYHQPIISFMHYSGIEFSASVTFIIAFTASTFLAWLTYRYVEKPLRNSVKSVETVTENKKNYLVIALIILLIFIATLGLAIAKSNGLEQRFKYLNPFAYELSAINSSNFHREFKRGMNVSNTSSSALFVGDSVLQHYVVPISDALGVPYTKVDTVTRGGCVLLKEVNFKDKFSDISCNSLRDSLYVSRKTYKYVVVSQFWESYGDQVTNFKGDLGQPHKWSEFISGTVEHFSDLADIVILIGGHPRISNSLELQPSLAASKVDYELSLKKIRVANRTNLKKYKIFYDSFAVEDKVIVIHPYDIFCTEECEIENGEWSYFSDQEHLSSVGSDFVESYLSEILPLVN